jgi:phosphoribosylformylglycinamidine synthase
LITSWATHAAGSGRSPADLKAFFAAIQDLNATPLMLLAYHDRSDGGLLATLCEMAFAGHCGVTVLIWTIWARTDLLPRCSARNWAR